jgi:transposase
MIGPPPGTRVYLACGVTDMRRGFDSLSAQVESVLNLDPYGGAVYLFRGRRLEKGRFVWPKAREGTVSLTAAQVSMLVEGIDWRQPVWTARPQTEIQV